MIKDVHVNGFVSEMLMMMNVKFVIEMLMRVACNGITIVCISFYTFMLFYLFKKHCQSM